MSVRVARHLAGVQALLESLAETDPDKTVEFAGLPDWTEILERGAGAFLLFPMK